MMSLFKYIISICIPIILIPCLFYEFTHRPTLAGLTLGLIVFILILGGIRIVKVKKKNKK